VLGLGGEHEAGIMGVARVQRVVVVVDPDREALAEALQKGRGDLLEARARALGGEGDVEHRHAAGDLRGLGELAG
jgi:hypothetical protein